MDVGAEEEEDMTIDIRVLLLLRMIICQWTVHNFTLIIHVII